MNNRTVLVVLGGCGALLFLCIVCLGLSVVLDVPAKVMNVLGIQNQIIEAIQTPEVSVPVVPTLGAVPTVGSIGKAPTLAPVPTTAPSAPTKAPSGSSSTGSNPFADAVSKAKSATKYRLQMQMIVGGTSNGKYTEQALFDMSGEIDGKKSHLTSQGGIMAMLTGDANGTLEIITADGKTYMKGIKLLGDPNTWYISSNSSSSGMEDFAKPDSFTDFTGSGQNDFKRVGNESVDGRSCDIWSGSLKGFDSSFLGSLGALGSKDTSDLSTVDKSETRVWLCTDGYVHKFAVDYQGHSGTNAAEKGAFKMNAHLWDFNNASINIQAPQGAKPMPGSQ